MPARKIHSCLCSICQEETDHPDKREHQRINLLLSRLDEQQRRWFVAHESQRIGYGGDRILFQITGLDEKTIARGRQELEEDLANRPIDRTRLPGGGRPDLKKKNQP